MTPEESFQTIFKQKVILLRYNYLLSYRVNSNVTYRDSFVHQINTKTSKYSINQLITVALAVVYYGS